MHANNDGTDNVSLILERYSRQMLLPNFGMNGQKKLLASQVLVVGAGGIGSTVCMYLAAAGISVSVVDPDVVETSNLHRCDFKSIMYFI